MTERTDTERLDRFQEWLLDQGLIILGRRDEHHRGDKTQRYTCSTAKLGRLIEGPDLRAAIDLAIDTDAAMDDEERRR